MLLLVHLLSPLYHKHFEIIKKPMKKGATVNGEYFKVLKGIVSSQNTN